MGHDLEKLREELNRLMMEEIACLKQQTFGGLNAEELRQQEERLKRIREVSADFIAALQRSTSATRSSNSPVESERRTDDGKIQCDPARKG